MKRRSQCLSKESLTDKKDPVVEAYRYLATDKNLPNYLTFPQYIPNGARVPRSNRLNVVDSVVATMVRAVELDETASDLKRRIAALPLPDDRNRPVPDTPNPDILGKELKLRLAATSPVIGERAGPKGRTVVEKKRKKRAFIPIHDINNEEDFTPKCYVPIKKRKTSTR